MDLVKMFNIMVENADFRANVPVGYVLITLAVLAGGYFLVRKVTAMAYAVFENLSIPMLVSGILFVGGLAGSGWSVGNLNSGPETKRKNEYVLTNNDLKTLSGPTTSADKLKEILTYARERERNITIPCESSSYVWITHDQPESTQANIESQKDYSIPCSILFASLGLVVCGILKFLLA